LIECIEKCLQEPALNVELKLTRTYAASTTKLPNSLVEDGAKLAIESFLKI